jgi:hypothetical protein
MTDIRTIEVRLPAQADPTPEDLELLDATFHAILDLRFHEGHRWNALARELASRGWRVDGRLMWVAEARRGREVEQAVGRTKDEAYEQLQQMTKLDELPGVL